MIHMSLFTKPKQTYRHSKLMVTKRERDNLCVYPCCHREFSGGPVLALCAFTAVGLGLIPGWGTNIAQAMRYASLHPKRKIKNPCCCKWHYFILFFFVAK